MKKIVRDDFDYSLSFVRYTPTFENTPFYVTLEINFNIFFAI